MEKDILTLVLVLVYFASFIFLLVANTYSYLTQGEMAFDFKGKRGKGDYLPTATLIALLLCGLCPGLLFAGLPNSTGAYTVFVNGVRTSGGVLSVTESFGIGLVAALLSYVLALGISFGIYHLALGIPLGIHHLRNFVRGKKGRIWIVLGAVFLLIMYCAVNIMRVYLELALR